MTNEHAHTSTKDVFLHLFSIVTLYWTAIAFIALLFQYVSYWFPDVLYYGDFRGPLTFALSSLVIIFPLHLVSMWLLEKEYAKEPGKRQMKLRKWLVYFTLFVTALIMSGDLVSLVYSYLEGELTMRFALKALSVLVVAAVIFGFYLWDMKVGEVTKNMRQAMWVVVAVMVAVIIGGFFLAGSPQQQRAYRLDDQRVNDLANIQGQVIYTYQSKEVLPASLDALQDEISGYTVPVDPETKQPYAYRVTGTNTFELCATFNQESRENGKSRAVPEPSFYTNDTWEHAAGTACFERTIDPQLYPPFSNTR